MNTLTGKASLKTTISKDDFKLAIKGSNEEKLDVVKKNKDVMSIHEYKLNLTLKTIEQLLKEGFSLTKKGLFIVNEELDFRLSVKDYKSISEMSDEDKATVYDSWYLPNQLIESISWDCHIKLFGSVISECYYNPMYFKNNYKNTCFLCNDSIHLEN